MKPFNVLDPDLNVLQYRFLEASAGTGKTFAIENLYVRLILEGIPVRAILVVTFTKAATQELIERIHGRLHKIHAEATDEKQLLLLNAALASFDEAKIFTIHGFCHAMLHKFGLQSGSHLIFSDNKQENLKTALLPEFIDYLRAHISPGAFHPLQLQVYFGDLFEEKLEELLRMWHPNIEDSLPSFDEALKSIEERLQTIGKYPEPQVLEDLEKYDKIFNKLTPFKKDYPLVARICATNKISSHDIAQLVEEGNCLFEFFADEYKKKKAKELPLLFPELPEKLHRLTPLFEDLINKKKIGHKLCAGFSAYRMQFGRVGATPDELLVGMKNALANKEFIDAVQGQFDAAVIDEFQDTDQVQWDIFSTLFLEKRTLKSFCLVGDPKQSIYAFRSADLYTYLGAKEMFFPEERETLGTNYRSEKGLVGALNALLASDFVFNWMRLPKIGGSLEVLPVGSVREDSAPLKELGNVHFLLAHGSEKTLFAYIVKQIDFWKEQNIKPNQMAVLVKDRYEAKRFIEYLLLFGIKTHYVEERDFASSLVFESIVDLIAALEKPRDPLRLKKVLAGSLVAWPEQRLREEIPSQALFGLQNLLFVFEEKGLAAMLQAFFEEPWCDEKSIAVNLLENGAYDNHEEFFCLFEKLIEEGDQCKMSLRNLKLHLERMRIAKEPENKRPSTDENAIEITTIFKSKGLEYEIVFPLALATHARQKDDDEEKIAEKMRLFYVALTRARRCVYLPWLIREVSEKPTIIEEYLSHIDATLNSEVIKEKLSLLSANHSVTIEELIPNVTQNLAVGYKEMPNVSLLCERAAHFEVPEPTPFINTYPTRQITSFTALSKGLKAPSGEKATQQVLPVGAETGVFIHALLETIFRDGLHHPIDIPRIATLCQKMAIDTPFAQLQEEIMNMIQQVLTLPVTPLHPGKSVFTLSQVDPSLLTPEMEFIYPLQTDLLKGFIDLVFMHEDLYYIIDWKTNWLPDYSPDQIEASIIQHRYDLQAKIYAEALKRYVKLFDKRPFKECFGGAYYLYLRGLQWKSLMP